MKKKGYWLCIIYTYKDYYTIIHFYEKNKLFYGKLEEITDSVSLNGKTLDIVEQNCKNKWNFDDKKNGNTNKKYRLKSLERVEKELKKYC